LAKEHDFADLAPLANRNEAGLRGQQKAPIGRLLAIGVK